MQSDTALEPGEFPLTLHLLGPFDARIDGRPLPPLRTRKGYWLLALLALHKDRSLQRDWIAGTLWPDSPQSQALYSLRRSLADLRQALGQQATRLHSPIPNTLCLDLTNAFCDVIRFDIDTARGDIPSLEEAVRLYRGPLLTGWNEEWMLSERAVREQTYLQTLEKLADTALEREDHAAAIGYLRLAVSADPMRENAQRGLIRALAAEGNQAAAIAVYRELRLRLYQELNTEPDPETTALFKQIRSQAHQGEQVKRARLPAAVSPARAGNIPQPLSRLIGRDQEIREVCAYLETARLVTLTGAGGVGKTRLAIAVSQVRLDHWPDGAWFVNLAPITDKTPLAQVVASALELHEEPGRPLMQTLLDYLRSRKLLILLDNCEHLIDVAAQLAETLLSACGQMQILATSRQSLGLTGERLYRVPCLAAPEPQQLQATEKNIVSFVLDYEAPQLFIERAQSVQPEFRITQENVAAIVQICQRLDGIPLALELAAARVRAMSALEIAARLNDRFRLLTGGSRTALLRHQTLYALLDWSYQLLNESEQAILERLSVFANGWTLEACEAVCIGGVVADWEALDLLLTLVDRSLVKFEAYSASPGRYQLLETVRYYAHEKLAQRQEDKVFRARHANYYCHFAEEIRPKCKGADLSHWLSILETEHENLRAALDWYAEASDGGEAGLRLAAALQGFWQVRGYFSEAKERLARCLAHPGAQEPTDARADALNGLGAFAIIQHDYASARALHIEALEIRRNLNDRKGIADSLTNLGIVAKSQGEYRVAQTMYEEAIALQRELNNRLGEANLLITLGNVECEQGNYGAAQPLLEAAYSICKAEGNRSFLVYALFSLGDLAYQQGDLAKSLALYSECLQACREIGDQRLGLHVMEGVGSVVFKRGYAEQAARCYGAADGLRIRLGLTSKPDELDEEREAIRRTLGEDAFRAALNAGSALDWEAAIAYTLEVTVEKAG